TEADNGVGGVPIGTYTSGLNTAAATLVGLTTAELQIWHRPIPDGAPGGPRVGAAQTVLSGVALGSWKTQRRRASGGRLPYGSIGSADPGFTGARSADWRRPAAASRRSARATVSPAQRPVTAAGPRSSPRSRRSAPPAPGDGSVSARRTEAGVSESGSPRAVSRWGGTGLRPPPPLRQDLSDPAGSRVYLIGGVLRVVIVVPHELGGRVVQAAG